MKFPEWVLKASKKNQASARLRYLVYRIALEASPKPTVRALCENIDIDHSTVTTYITRGAFSPNLARLFEKKFGRDIADAMWLTDPLCIVPTNPLK